MSHCGVLNVTVTAIPCAEKQREATASTVLSSYEEKEITSEKNYQVLISSEHKIAHITVRYAKYSF
jgi:thiamine biosynthesis lipoprotein ApbE